MARPFVLPREFPEGTRFVVEGRPGSDGKTRIVSRYLVFPDGRRVDLPLAGAPKGARRRRLFRNTGRRPKVRSGSFRLH